MQTQTNTKFHPVFQWHLQVSVAAPGTTTCKLFPGSRSCTSNQLNFVTTWMGWKDVISLCKDGQRVTEIKLSKVSIKFRCSVCSSECCPLKTAQARITHELLEEKKETFLKVIYPTYLLFACTTHMASEWTFKYCWQWFCTEVKLWSLPSLHLTLCTTLAKICPEFNPTDETILWGQEWSWWLYCWRNCFCSILLSQHHI